MSSFKEYLLENPLPNFTLQGGVHQQNQVAPAPQQQQTPQPIGRQNTNPEWWKSYADVSRRLQNLSFSRPPGTYPNSDIAFYKALLSNSRRAQMTQADIAKLALQYKTSPSVLD